MIKITVNENDPMEVLLGFRKIHAVVVPSPLASVNTVTVFLGGDLMLEMPNSVWKKFASLHCVDEQLCSINKGLEL